MICLVRAARHSLRASNGDVSVRVPESRLGTIQPLRDIAMDLANEGIVHFNEAKEGSPVHARWFGTTRISNTRHPLQPNSNCVYSAVQAIAGVFMLSRVSTNTVWPSASVNFCASARANTSEAPPAA